MCQLLATLRRYGTPLRYTLRYIHDVLAPVTNWEPHGVTLAGYCYAMRHGVKVQILTPYHVSHLQRYGVTVRGNVTKCVPTFTLEVDYSIFN
jgi:hypothetical protein